MKVIQINSGIYLYLIILPVQLKIWKQRQFHHALRNAHTPNQSLIYLPTNDVPRYRPIIHVDHRSYLVLFLWFDIHIGLFIFLAYGAIVAIVANTVYLFETELLVFVGWGYDADDDVVVFYVEDADVEVKAAGLRDLVFVVELVGWAVEFLYLVV